MITNGNISIFEAVEEWRERSKMAAWERPPRPRQLGRPAGSEWQAGWQSGWQASRMANHSKRNPMCIYEGKRNQVLRS